MTVLRSPLRTALRSSVYSPLVGKWGGEAIYYVDGENGDDNNDGLSPETAKASIQAVGAPFIAGSGNATVHVAPGTYKGGPYFPSGSFGGRRKITYLMAGVTIDCEDDVDSAYMTAVNNYRKNLTVEVVGPCTLENVGNDCINLGGAHGSGEEAIVIVRQATCQGAGEQACSAHDNGIAYLYDCTLYSGPSSPSFHVGNARAYHYGCTIYCAASAQAVGGTGNAYTYLNDCDIIATETSSKGPGVSESAITEVVGCRITRDGGTWAINTVGLNARVLFRDSYAEDLAIELTNGSEAVGCYGSWCFRPARGDGTQADVTIRNCVLTGSASNSGRAIDWASYGTGDFNGGSGGEIKDNIFINTASTAIRSVTTTGAVDAINSLWSLQNNLFYNNVANYSAGLTPDGVDVTGQNPLLVSPSGPNRAGWLVQAGSPAIGAGTGGGNIGIGVAD